MTDNDFLDGLLTPEEIARRITASSGVHMTARTVWEKARRIGVAKKIGRSPLIHLSDVPRLLEEETKSERRAHLTRITTGPAALSILQKARKKRARP
ncbi:hypothetical protein GOL96_29790 [Sinorhizobium medicae]|uniref:hypothetical protein n=1 Tax=Rhizobium meliloti TaxID=382 RepID=UPI00129582AB|nr:hypothetical protein [Sinorhizobium meliloti]MDX1195290.1 hypothetical protein [Sinorhizobium medicae]MDX1237932.1 hypothetical protein [Sinorhizobium medicae]MQU69068.1 hypothetical protein [Sinorhizobium meliloti]